MASKTAKADNRYAIELNNNLFETLVREYNYGSLLRQLNYVLKLRLVMEWSVTPISYHGTAVYSPLAASPATSHLSTTLLDEPKSQDGPPSLSVPPHCSTCSMTWIYHHGPHHPPRRRLPPRTSPTSRSPYSSSPTTRLLAYTECPLSTRAECQRGT